MLRVRSGDSLIIEARLRELQIGDSVTYADLSTLIGRDVRTSRALIETARKHLMEEGVHFDVVRGTGYVRITHDQAVRASKGYVQKARNASKRGLKQLQSVEFKDLSPDAQRLHMATSTQLGMVHLFSKESSAKKIAGAIDNNKIPPQSEVLRLFS